MKRPVDRALRGDRPVELRERAMVVQRERGRAEEGRDECDRRDDTQLLVDTASRESRDGVEGGEWRRNRVEAEEWGAES